MKNNWLGYSIPFGVLAIIFMLFPFWEVDDAFIVLRYAKNWAATGAPVWNPGTDPVEGYTGFIWMGLATLLLKMNTYPLLIMRGLAIISCFGTLLLMLRIGQKADWSPLVLLVTLLMVALSPLLYTHATSGLETAFFSFTLLLSLRAYQWAANRPENRIFPALLLGTALLLCGLTRPEGVIMGGVVTGFYLWSRLKNSPDGFRKALLGIFLGFVLPGVVYFVTRWQFYGQLFPNTVYAKGYQGLVNPAVFLEAVRFGLHYLSGSLVALALLAFWGRKSRGTIRTLHFPLITGMVSLGVLLGYSQTHLYMGYSFRFFAPFLPLILMGMADLGNQWVSGINWENKRSAWIFLLIFLLQGVLWGRKFKQEVNFVHTYQAVMEEELKPAGNWLAAELPAGATVAVYMDVGAISWFSDHRIIDFGRLNDETLSQLPPESAKVVDYFYDLNPDACVFTSFHPDTLNYIPEASQIQSDKRFHIYKKVKTFSTSIPFDYHQFVYIRQPVVPLR